MGYRHPHCIVVLLCQLSIDYREERREKRVVVENTHVQRFELIERASIQIHEVVFVLCVCMLNVMLMDVYFLLYIFFICRVYDFILCV
jgi:hypothetical protein